MIFWLCGKNGLIRQIILISKFTTPQPGQQTIAIDILPNVSQIKGNQAMKLGQLIKQQAKYFYSKNMRKMGQGDPFQTSFYCLKMLNMR